VPNYMWRNMQIDSSLASHLQLLKQDNLSSSIKPTFS
jgi:hypothetical protein